MSSIASLNDRSAFPSEVRDLTFDALDLPWSRRETAAYRARFRWIEAIPRLYRFLAYRGRFNTWARHLLVGHDPEIRRASASYMAENLVIDAELHPLCWVQEIDRFHMLIVTDLLSAIERIDQQLEQTGMHTAPFRREELIDHLRSLSLT